MTGIDSFCNIGALNLAVHMHISPLARLPDVHDQDVDVSSPFLSVHYDSGQSAFSYRPVLEWFYLFSGVWAASEDQRPLHYIQSSE